MKKILFLFGVSILFITSCTPEPNVPPTDNITDSKLLFKKIFHDDKESSVTYDGFKIAKVENPFSTYSVNFTYTGDLVTNETSIDVDYIISTEYMYENGKLKSSLRKENNGNGTPLTDRVSHEYIYNADSTVTDKATGYSDGIRLTVFTFQNGNIIKEAKFDESGQNIYETEYEYDTKYNPFKNILGFDKFINPQISSKNNIIKFTKTSGSGDYTIIKQLTNTYKYNNKGYPLTVETTVINNSTSNTPETDSSTTQYVY